MNSTQVAIKIEYEHLNGFKRNSSEFAGPFQISKQGDICKPLSLKISEWSPLENAKYAAFIDKNMHLMEGKSHGKLWGLHQEMSKFIKTRNFRQCKLHHQRLSNEIGNIPQIISYFNKKEKHFQEMFLRQKENLNLLWEGFHSSREKVLKVENELYEKIGKQDQKPTDYIYRSEEEIENVQNIKKMAPSMMAQNQNMEKWKQCHNYFLEWTSRLNELIVPELDY